jgi:hypothetical protein
VLVESRTRAAPTVAGNTVRGALAWSGNSIVSVYLDAPGTVAGARTGQCSDRP